MSEVEINSSVLGSDLEAFLTSNEGITPGYRPSYQMCKILYEQHPLGSKIIDKPLQMAQSQRRDVAIPASPGERCKEAFEKEWVAIGATRHIRDTMRLSRIYGIGSIAAMQKGVDSNKPLDYDALWKAELSFNHFDPLNTAGSLVLNQDPRALDFQHVTDIRVGGMVFHRSRTCVVMNEAPIYISFTPSAFGFVGRSAFTRAIFPMKSFIQTMKTDDLVAVKAGVLVAKVESPGSIVSGAMAFLQGLKRSVVKEAQNGGVISVSADKNEDISSINLTNLEGPLKIARTDILENIASAIPMPAKLLTEETLAEGFGEGTEDAKQIARYIDLVREDMEPLYRYFEKIVMYRAWNPDFYKVIQHDFSDQYGGKSYQEAFYEWKNSFTSSWPSFLSEPPSELVRVDDVKLRALIALLEVMMPSFGPLNRQILVQFVADNINSMKLLFSGAPLNLDEDELEDMGVAGEDDEDLPDVEGEDTKPRVPVSFGMKRSDASVRAYADALQSYLNERDERRSRIRLLRGGKR